MNIRCSCILIAATLGLSAPQTSFAATRAFHPGECVNPQAVEFHHPETLKRSPKHFEYQVSGLSSPYEIILKRVNIDGKVHPGITGFDDAEAIVFKNTKTHGACEYLYSKDGDQLDKIFMNARRAYLYSSVGAGESVDVVDPATCKVTARLDGWFFTVYRAKFIFHAACESTGPANDFTSCECSPAEVYLLSSPDCEPVLSVKASELQTQADLDGVAIPSGKNVKMKCPPGWW